MKHYILIFMLIVFVLTGCTYLVTKNKPQETTGEQLYSFVSLPTSSDPKQQFFTEYLSGTIYITGIYSPITISDYLLTISGCCSLYIPKASEKFIYHSQHTPANNTYFEQLFFSDNLEKKSFTMSIYKLIGPRTTSTDQEICTVSYPDGYITKYEKIHTVQGQKIYAYYASLMVHGLDVKPFKVIDTQFCFVRSGFVYKFSASNYPHSAINNIITSIVFLD